MPRVRRLAWIVLPATAAAAFAFVGVASGAGESPKPLAKIADVMLTFNAPPEGVVQKLKATLDAGNLDDEGWDLVGARSAMTVEAANLLYGMKPPLGTDDKWHDHVMAYRGCADAIHDAAGKKDLAGARAGIQSLLKKCNECHNDHKKKE